MEKVMVEFSKSCASWKIIVQLVTGNIIISEVDAFMYVLLSKAETHMPCGNHRMYDVTAEIIITEFTCTLYLQLHQY
jgi:hypothetical protein